MYDVLNIQACYTLKFSISDPWALKYPKDVLIEIPRVLLFFDLTIGVFKWIKDLQDLSGSNLGKPCTAPLAALGLDNQL